MDFDAYVAARRGRLVEHAVGAGCPAPDAPALVDAVLARQRRRIARTEDPHPELLAAVDRALAPPTPRRSLGRRGRLLLGAAAGAAVLAAVTVALLPDPPVVETLPSAFGLPVEEARRGLEQAGYGVRLEPVQACEPLDLVVSTSPGAGARVRAGSTVTVRPARPPGDNCLATYPDRSAAWAFVGWVRGGPAPVFTTTVNLVIDGQGPRSVYTGAGVEREAFGPVLERLAAAFATPAPTRNGLPRLLVTSGPPPLVQCGVRRPAPSNNRSALRLQVDPTPETDEPCPLTVDLFRYDSCEIDAVVVYSAQPA